MTKRQHATLSRILDNLPQCQHKKAWPMLETVANWIVVQLNRPVHTWFRQSAKPIWFMDYGHEPEIRWAYYDGHQWKFKCHPWIPELVMQDDGSCIDVTGYSWRIFTWKEFNL